MQQPQPPNHHSGPFVVGIGDTSLRFRDVTLSDPVPTGRQLLEAAGANPPDEHIIIQWLGTDDLQEINLDRTTDLRGKDQPRFIIAKSDRSFRFEIDGHVNEWPERLITREVLLALAGQDPAKFSVWQDMRQSADKEILSGEPADLGEKGTERFYTVMKHTTEGNR